MAEKNKLYITITDKRDGDGPTPTPTPQGSSQKSDDLGMLGRYAEHELFHLVKNQTTQAVNYALANIGDLSGDYISQRKVNVAKQAISGIMQVGTATIAGARVGGYIGAAIGFVVGTISLISGSVYNELESRKNNRLTNLEIAQLRDRAGLNSVYDGSRGTEN